MTRRWIWGEAPIRVFKNDGVWRWECHHVGFCTGGGWAAEQHGALNLGLRHLRRHNLVGFRTGSSAR